MAQGAVFLCSGIAVNGIHNDAEAKAAKVVWSRYIRGRWR